MLMSGKVLKTNGFFKKKSILILGIYILLSTILYYVLCFATSAASLKFSTSPSRTLLSSSLLFSSKITHDQCRLSLNESDGWFCELNDDWKRRKHLHHMQDRRNHISDERSLFFQNNWEPTIHCEFERRLGNVGDGGKWICDIHNLKLSNFISLIYSFGSNGDFSFEQAIKQELPQSEIHTFDINIYKCPENVCTFHQARLGNGRNDGSKSLQNIVDELAHRQRTIDILKVDIDGGEFNLFSELFKSINSLQNETQILYIRQILVEIHIPAGTGDNGSRLAHTLFELFRQNNYAIFHKEANLYDAQNVFEYAFIRLHPTFFIPS